jgi:bifunctional DNase/RNase
MTDAGPVTDAPEGGFPTFIVCTVGSVTVDLPETFARVNLHEADLPFRGLAIPVAIPDAAAMTAVVAERPAPRPSSQDLLATVLQRHTIDVVAARITAEQGGVYFAELDLVGPKGRIVLECRPTDAINAALRHPGGAPILVEESLLGV